MFTLFNILLQYKQNFCMLINWTSSSTRYVNTKIILLDIGQIHDDDLVRTVWPWSFLHPFSLPSVQRVTKRLVEIVMGKQWLWDHHYVYDPYQSYANPFVTLCTSMLVMSKINSYKTYNHSKPLRPIDSALHCKPKQMSESDCISNHWLI